MWSVEWIPKSDPHNCWNQYVLTRYKWSARLQQFDARFNLGNRNNYRIREV
jgi:hypothetical protein